MEFGLLEQLTLATALWRLMRGLLAPPCLLTFGDEHGEFQQVDGPECAMTYVMWEINRDLFGRRVLDVIRSIDYVLSRPGSCIGNLLFPND